jgi:hypothetical protein
MMTANKILDFAFKGIPVQNSKMIIFEVRRRQDGSLYTCNEFATIPENNKTAILITPYGMELSEAESEKLCQSVRRKLGV